MASSLARQLAQGASLNASLLVDRSRRQPTQSYLFTPRQADQHDLDSIHALGVNGFQQLKSIEPIISIYEDALFSDAAKASDRTLQTSEANQILDAAVDGLLPLLGPHLLEAPSGKVLEWLVRRFRVHEFNVESILATFMPYHESPHFAKMLAILHISEQSKFSALLPYKATSSPLTHGALVDIMIKHDNSDFARFIGSLLPRSVSVGLGALHRTLVAFHTGVLLEFVKRSSQKGHGGSFSEGVLAWLLPSALEPLQHCSKPEPKGPQKALLSDVILASYLLLSAISHTCPLSAEALTTILKGVTSCAMSVSPTQVLRTLGSICAAQTSVPDQAISKNVIKAVLKLDGADNELKELSKYSGTERFIWPLVQALLERLEEERAFAVLTSLVMYPDFPKSILVPMCSGLIRLSLQQGQHGSESAIQPRMRSLLVHLHQRHPQILQNAFQDALSDEKLDKNAAEQLLLSLSVQLPEPMRGHTGASANKTDIVLATVSADATVRASAVRTLYEQMSTGSRINADTIRSALLARVQDSAPSVVEALYSSPDHLLPIVRSEGQDYATQVAQILNSQSPAPSRALIKAHLSFIAGHLYPSIADIPGSSALRTFIALHILFSQLMFSKVRPKSATLVWEILETSEKQAHSKSLSSHELFRGCIEAVRWEEGKAPKETSDGSYERTQIMANVNIALAAKIAENIASSSSFEPYFEFLLAQMKGSNPHSKDLAYLVCRALLTQFSGERQVEIAHRTLKAIDLVSLEGIDDFLRGSENLQVFMHDLSLATAVVLKPTKRNTFHRLQVALLVAMAHIPRPIDLTFNWLLPSSTPGEGLEHAYTVVERYVDLAGTLYALANSTATLPVVSNDIIRGLSISLGDDILKFLACVWINHDNLSVSSASRYAALRHANAYLEAHFSTGRFIDFQLIVPALLIAVGSTERRLREAALDCVTVLVRLSQAKKPESVYAFDAMYGSKSAVLEYLDWADFCKYIQALHQSHQHLLNDSSYLSILHQQLLVVLKTDRKKDAGYKQRVLCYLLSHVTACQHPMVQLVLLKSVQEISSPVKFRSLSLVIDAMMDGTTPHLDDELVSLLLASADEMTATALNDAGSSLWTAYTNVLRHFFQSGTFATARSTIGHGLRSGLFSKLTVDRKVEVCRILVDIGCRSLDTVSGCRELLAALITDADIICQLLAAFQPSVTDTSQRASKRARIESNNADEDYASLTLLVEVLGGRPLPGSSELVVALLDSLSKTISDGSVAPADKTYVEQLLLSALDNVVSNIPIENGKALHAVRLDTLVELIRVSENPQTFNQALLLIASLAKLVPEVVLQNIMPVFTFMGSNVFQRDDSYSFNVVQKTVESIVPVMTVSLKQKHPEKLDRQIAARTFLRIFTDAYNHIPRHRRISFFVHLVKVLGPSDFLSAIGLLLVDKMANKVVRQNHEDIVVSLSLPLGVFERFDPDVQLEALVEMLRESRRLLESASPETNNFLELSISEEERGSSSQTRRKQAQAVVTFASFALQQLASMRSVSSGSSSAILALLLDIAVLRDDQLDQLSDIARGAVTHALRVMSAKEFVLGVLKVLNSGKPQIQNAACEVLGEQLGNVSDKVRQELRPEMVKILEVIKQLLPSASEQLLPAALRSLDAISSTMSPGEEYALTATVPAVIATVQRRKATSSALSILLSLVKKLGPRIIPFFRDIIKECAGVIDESDAKSQVESIGVLHALLTSIPSFWSSGDFLLVIELYLKQHSSESQHQASQLSSFIKAMAKRAPSKVLLPTICDLWTRMSADGAEPARISAYLFVLRRSIQHIDRAMLPDYLRSLFKTFINVFELCAAKADLRLLVESDAIAAFVEMVVKLNEATFKPLFRKLFDWAFTGTQSSKDRQLVLLHVYNSLVDHFKSLMTPYMFFLLSPLIELLQGYRADGRDSSLWAAVIETLTTSCSHDEGAFWREDKLHLLIGPVVAQIPVCLSFESSEPRDSLRRCLIALAGAVNDSSSLKTLNLNVLMHTRSEDARVRVQALSSNAALWQAHGGKFIGFASETATFIAECAEDDNDNVVREAHRLKNAVESIAGRIDV